MADLQPIEKGTILCGIISVFGDNSPRGGGGGGGTLIFSYIRRLGPFFGVKFLNFNIFWGFQKNEYFLGYENFVDIFLGSSQNWTSFYGLFLCILGSFLKVNMQNRDIFLGCKNFKYFFGVLEISDIFGGER